MSTTAIPACPLNSKWFTVHQHCIPLACVSLLQYKAEVVASQLGLLAATGSVQCQRHQLDWIEEIFDYPMMYGTNEFEAYVGSGEVWGLLISKPLDSVSTP